MKRSVKFKAWDKRTNTMFITGGLLIGHGASSWEYPKKGEEPLVPTEDSNLILMQYTNLDDINRKELYRCDIFKDDDWSVGIAVIEFYNGCFGFWYNEEPNKRFVPLSECKKKEKIGNKFENPELLNKYKEYYD